MPAFRCPWRETEINNGSIVSRKTFSLLLRLLNSKDWNKLLNIEVYFSGSKKYDFYDQDLCARGRLEAKGKDWEQYEDGRSE